MKKQFLTILFAFVSFFALGASDFSVGLDGYSWISATGTSNLDGSSAVTYSDPTFDFLPGLHLNLFLGDQVGFFGEVSVNLAPEALSSLPLINLNAGVAFQLLDDGTNRFEVGVGPTLQFMWFGGGLGVYAYPEWTFRLTENLGLELKLGMAWYPLWGFLEVMSTDPTGTYHYDYINFAVTPYVGLKFM